MKYIEKEILYSEFQNNWGEQFSKIPFILKYISTYPEVTGKLKDFRPIAKKALHSSQLEWIALVTQFDNPIERKFFKEYWVPIQKDGYDYFIDLSSDSLSLFEIHYFFFEPYRWYKKYVFKDLSQFLINLDNYTFSIEKHFKHLDKQRWSDVKDFFNERDELGFEGKLELDPIEKDDIFDEGQNSNFLFEGNSITFSGINSVIIGLLPYDYIITLETFNAPYKRNENVCDNVKTIKSLVYLIQSVGMLSIESYSIMFDSENKCSAEFKDNTFKIKHTDRKLLSSMIEKYKSYKYL